MNSIVFVRSHPRWRTPLIVLGWIVAGLCFWPWDLWLSRHMVAGAMPGEISGILHRAETFGHAYGVLGILITMFVLDPRRRPKHLHAALCFLAAGLAADLIKLQIWRMRPRPYFEAGRHAGTFLGSVWTSPRVDWSILVDHTRHSFPSAHTAGAVALAYSLGRLYPRGRVWFYMLAALCGLNRIDGGAHYASDVCWGAALGYLTAVLMPTAEQVEAWLAARRGPRSQGSHPGEPPVSQAA